MKRKVILITLGALLFVAVLTGGFYAYFATSSYFTDAIKARHKKQTLAENVEITSDWLEITPEKPLKPEKQRQEVIFSIEDYKFDSANSDIENTKLMDVARINSEVQIVDENDRIYRLRFYSRFGGDVGFSPGKDYYETYYSPKDMFPKHVIIKTIRVRSDKTFRCKMIYWKERDLK